MTRISFTVLSIGSALLLLSSCGTQRLAERVDSNATGSGSEISSSPYVTRNVSFVGTIVDLEASIYQEGSHKLVLNDGQFILLQSTDENLSLVSYLGKRVEVRGSVRPTVEGNGEILRVEEVTVLEQETATGSLSSAASSARTMCGGIAAFPCDSGLTCVDDPSDSCDPLSGGADCGGICVAALAVSSSSSSAAVSSVPRSSSIPSSASRSSVSSVAPQSMSSSQPIASDDAQVAMLAKQNYADSSLWTQQYCTSHIGFCVPAHKNWYFKSFGATTSNLWHVEFSSSPIESLHSGAIVLNLVAGTSASMDAKDGQIQSAGSDIVAFKDWTGGNHFEIIADASLREAVSYMLAHLSPYSVTE